MPNNAYTEAVRSAVLDCGWAGAELYRRLDLAGWVALFEVRPAESTVRNWLSQDAARIPRSAVPYLAKVFVNLPATVEAVEQRFGLQDWPQEKAKRRVSMPVETLSPFDAQLDRIDQERRLAGDHLKRASEETVELFRLMNKNHLFFATTLTEMPLIYQPRSEEHKPMIRARYEAVRNGAMFCVLVPDEALSNQVLITHQLDTKTNSKEFESASVVFRDNMIGYFAGPEVGAENAEEYVNTHVQMIKWGDMPFTPVCWTVSMLGPRKGRECKPRILIRAPEDGQNALRLFHHMEDYGIAMKSYALQVINRKLAEADKEAESASARATPGKSWLQIYLENFRARIRGLDDPYPTELVLRPRRSGAK